MNAKEKITKIVIENIRKLVSENLPQLIEEAVNDCIYDIVDEEVNQMSAERLSSALEDISKMHAIPLDLLLRDMPRDNLCKGTKMSPDGMSKLRCSFKSVHDGYCKYHRLQGERIKRRALPSMNLHTHGADKMFVRGCPGCEHSNKLIDLGPFMGNE
jgi:hypothetical protein